ncbi:hypothetical protein HO133_004251 [Letharia lupina]|uniref:Peptidase S26 domain-containing protein n=1 Tax=Letharia lupina TaxID=560253 RepID=A0A8H6FJV9_9LECA|nr:uncharacterized protein HO133_004251 [Letharia lupina]KAF6229914.1 hypothetical protein HO133_004251 [Letharia lupina]
MPPLSPLQPLLNITSPRWGNRPRPRHAFQIQKYLFHSTKNEDEIFPYTETERSSQGPKRKELLRRLRFPRKYKSTPDKLWCVLKHTPQLLKTVIAVSVQFRSWQRERLPHGMRVKSRIGNFFYHLLTQREGICIRMLNMTIMPWGYVYIGRGDSMRPTYSGNLAFSYTAYAYVGSQDISPGDVVFALGWKYDVDIGCVIKRVAGLEGDRIWVDPGPNRAKYIIRIERGQCFLLGDNPSQSGDSREYGAVPVEAIWAKEKWQWGPDGFSWIDHSWHPWLKNESIVHLKPGQNRPPHQTEPDEPPSTRTPAKKRTVILNPKVKPPPPLPLSPLKKQRKDPRKKS